MQIFNFRDGHVTTFRYPSPRKTRLVDLPDGGRSLTICTVVQTQYRHWAADKTGNTIWISRCACYAFWREIS